MFQYVLKRLLLMVPTFLLITVLVFLLINLAPGQPPSGGGGASGSEQADQSGNAREGYRLFKEQYNLDKPILLNFRFTLQRPAVERRLQTIARNSSLPSPGEAEAWAVGATTARVLGDIANREYVALQADLAAPDLTDTEREELQTRVQNLGYVQVDPIRPERPPQGEIFDAEEWVENMGNVIVPHLLEIAEGYVYLVPEGAEDPWFDGVGAHVDDVDGLEPGPFAATTVQYDGRTHTVDPVLTRKVRFLAVQRLSVNAKRRVVIGDGERADEAQQALNREIVTENETIAGWTYAIDASDEEIAAIVSQWHDWFEEHRADRYDMNFGRRMHMLFIETRFARYWGNLARLDLGTSIRYRRPVLEVIGEHWQYSIFLSLASLFLAYFISIPLGVLAAVKQNQFADRGIGLLLFVLYSLPSFFVATLLSTYLTPASEGMFESAPTFIQSVHAKLAVFPVSGFRGVDRLDATTWEIWKDVLWHLVLPVISLTYASLAVLSRYARTGLLDVLRSDYIRTARAKGLNEFVVIMKHAVRNGMIPILTLLGTTLPVLIGGSIIIEFIFNIDGMGKLMLTAIQFRDYNIIMGVLLISSILTLIGILLSDISYALVDPRISFD